MCLLGGNAHHDSINHIEPPEAIVVLSLLRTGVGLFHETERAAERANRLATFFRSVGLPG